MTPTQTRTVSTMVLNLFPRICGKWTKDEWDSLAGELERIEGVDDEQARAVLRRYRAENDRPSHKGILAALRAVRVANVVAAHQAQRNARVDHYRREMAKRGAGEGWTDQQILAQYARREQERRGTPAAIEFLVEHAKDTMDETTAFGLVRGVFGTAGDEYVSGILAERESRRQRRPAARLKGVS